MDLREGSLTMGRDSTQHPPSCAKRLCLDGQDRGLSIEQLVQDIFVHCHVSKLRAHRLARGLTLKQAADGLRAIATQRGDGAPRVDAIQLSSWETGRHQPQLATLGLLRRLYDCSVEDLGLDRAAAPERAQGSAHQQAEVVNYPPAPDLFGSQVDDARRLVDRTLAASSISSGQLDLLDERILWARQQYVYTPPDPMLVILLEHLREVANLAADRQPAATQVRLSELTALLATLVADGLMKLGHLSRSRAWYDTARSAADDSGNAELRARVRAQAAMLPFYYGPLEAAVSLSREALMILRGRPSATAAFAAAAESRARAKLGDEEGADAAIRSASSLFERSGPGGSDDDAFSFPERRFLLYKSGALTALGRTREAYQVQSEALALYPARTGIDPTLLHLEAAICLARDRSPSEACELAGATFLKVLPAHRTPIVEERAREVITTLPPDIRTTRSARQLHEILALPPSQM